jgi:hypothetical protein
VKFVSWTGFELSAPQTQMLPTPLRKDWKAILSPSGE